MRSLVVGAVACAILIANTARADFKVQPGLLPTPAPKVQQPVAAAPAAAAPVVTAPAVQEQKPESAQPKRAPLAERKEPVWVVKPGSRLRPVLEEFTRRAGWHLEMNFKDPITQQDADLMLGGGLHVQGDFKEAIRAIWDSLDTDKIDAEFWSENDPKTLYVFRKGMGK